MRKNMWKKVICTLLTLAMLIGMVALSASAATTLSSVAVRVVAPVAGRNPRYESNVDTYGAVLALDDDSYGEKQKDGVVWFCNGIAVPTDQPLEIGKAYTVRVIMYAADSYAFAANPTCTINGKAAWVQYSNAGYLSIEYTFPALEGFTISFNNGGGSGTMTSVTAAGYYTLPACTFTPPAGKSFKCWKISTDPYDWDPGEKISVSQDITVTAVWKTKSTRQEIFDVEATSEDLDSIPVLYGTMKIPSFTITQGAPAYINASRGNLKWQKKEGDVWKYQDSTRFTPGEWRVSTSVRIDQGSDSYALGNPVTLTVNGKKWTTENYGKPQVYPNYSMIWVYSPVYTIVDDPSIEPPKPVDSVVLSLKGYASGKAVSGATVTSNAKIKIEAIELFEANSLEALILGQNGIGPATGTFSPNKYYALRVDFAAQDGYVLDDLKAGDVTLPGGSLLMGQTIGDRFLGVFILEPVKGMGMTNPFTDVKKNDYFYAPVLWAVEKGVTTGTSKTEFSPAAPCTRAQAVTFLWRAAGQPTAKNGKNPFTDVKKSDYYYKAVLWAVENGVTTGTSPTTFSPEDPCTRGQIVTFLWRAQGGKKVSAANPFKDIKKSDYYYNAVLWAVKNNVTTGTAADKFSPADTCTRGQIVTFLYRSLH